MSRTLLLLVLLPQNCSFFLSLIGFDITWTLYQVLSRKLCNPDLSTWFLVLLKFGFVKQLTGWTCGINYGQKTADVVELKYRQQLVLSRFSRF